MAAFRLLARLEGIIPALESAACPGPAAARSPREVGKGGIVVVNLSGRGDKDLATVALARIGMASRIDARFAALKREGRAGFVAYVMAGDPDAETSLEILKGLPAAGADLIELGFPFSDPMAEGPPIQRAAQRALAAGMTLERRARARARAFRAADQATPIILMGYLNALLTHGLEAFARDAAAAGVDGADRGRLPAGRSRSAGRRAGRRRRGADPPGHAHHRRRAAEGRSPGARPGFIYYVSVAGVTGVKEVDAAGVGPAVARVRRATGLPVAVGFGIRTPEQAARRRPGRRRGRGRLGAGRRRSPPRRPRTKM